MPSTSAALGDSKRLRFIPFRSFRRGRCRSACRSRLVSFGVHRTVGDTVSGVGSESAILVETKIEVVKAK